MALKQKPVLRFSMKAPPQCPFWLRLCTDKMASGRQKLHCRWTRFCRRLSVPTRFDSALLREFFCRQPPGHPWKIKGNNPSIN